MRSLLTLQLGVALAEIGDDELGKARAIYSWIVNNIEYDVVRFQGVLSGRGQPKMSAKRMYFLKHTTVEYAQEEAHVRYFMRRDFTRKKRSLR